MENEQNNVEIYKNREKEFTLTAGLVNQIESKLNPFSLKLHDLSDEVNLILSLEASDNSCLKAKELLLKHVKIRTSVDKERKALGNVFKVTKQAIDWTAKGIIEDIQKVEEELKEFATTFERRKQLEIDTLVKERSELLEPYSDPSAFKLGEMEQSVFEMILKGAIAESEQKQKEEQERIIVEAEKEKEDILHKERTEILIPLWSYLTGDEKSLNFGSIKEIEFCEIQAYSLNFKINHDKEQERIKKENEALRAEQKKKDEQIRLEKIKQDKILAKERADKQELERELREKQEADRKAKEEKEAEELALKQAPDKEKFNNWLNHYLEIGIPEFSDEKFMSLGVVFQERVKGIIQDFESKI